MWAMNRERRTPSMGGSCQPAGRKGDRVQDAVEFGKGDELPEGRGCQRWWFKEGQPTPGLAARMASVTGVSNHSWKSGSIPRVAGG